MTEPLRVLILEDNPLDAELVLRELRKAGFEPDWQRVDTEAAYLARLSPSLDVILSDFEMPQFNGLRALEVLKAHGLDVPLIIISGTIGEDTAVEAVRQGASDYLLKDRIGRLGAAVRRAMKEVQDRAARQQLQAQLIEAQKMEVIGQLAAGVAHDFNNILAVVMSYCDLIGSEPGLGISSCGYVKEILHAAERGAGLTRQLLVFGSKQAIKPVTLDLGEAVRGLKPMLLRLIHEDIDLSIVLGERTGCVSADPGYVGQLLMNLVVNARDAMPRGGKLCITIQNVTLDPNHPDLRAGSLPGEYVMLTVCDSGTGMTDAVKAHLFEPFFTTKPLGKGTGLGLATCETIVRASSGVISVHSEVGRGTTFKIYFPRIEGSFQAGEKTLETGPLPRGAETLMVVEDEADLRHVASRVLEGQGYKVLSAANGEDALKLVREHKGSPVRLVITDVVMPVMGGEEAAAVLKATYPDVQILFTSGYTDHHIAYQGMPEENVEFLPKPFTPSSLARKVREMLDRSIPDKLRA